MTDLEKAKRCQWWTGSYYGSTLSCSCSSPKDCLVRKENITVDLVDMPAIEAAKQAKRDEYFSKYPNGRKDHS